MSKLHIFTVGAQPLVYHDVMGPVGGPASFVSYNPRHRFVCDICWRTREAKNLSIQVYYDMSRIFCTEKCEPIKYKDKRRVWAQQAYREKKAASQAAKEVKP